MKKVFTLSLILLMSLCMFAGCGSNLDENVDILEFFSRQHKSDLTDTKRWMVPDFSGWSCAEVTNVLDQIGQEYEIIFVNDENANVNAITGQNPNCGESVRKDQPLQLYVNNYYAKSNTITLYNSFINPISEMGKWIYFSDGISIYKSCDDFANCKKIYSHENIHETILSIMPRKSELFFITRGQDFTYCLYSVIEEDNKCIKIYQSKTCMDFFAVGDILSIFEFEGNIVQYYITENETIETPNALQTFSYLQHDGYRYYVKTGETKRTYLLCKQNILNNSVTILVESDKMITDMCIYNNSIYYVCFKGNNSDEVYDDWSDFYCVDEWLYKYDLQSNENILIKQIGFDQVAGDTSQLFIWQDSIVVANADRIIKVRLEDDAYNEIEVNRPEAIFGSNSILCGNYVYEYFPYIENIMFCNGRYNLLTDEYEEFDWVSKYNIN